MQVWKSLWVCRDYCTYTQHAILGRLQVLHVSDTNMKCSVVQEACITQAIALQELYQACQSSAGQSSAALAHLHSGRWLMRLACQGGSAQVVLWLLQAGIAGPEVLMAEGADAPLLIAAKHHRCSAK